MIADEMTRTMITDLPWQVAVNMGIQFLPVDDATVPVHRPAPKPVDMTRVSAYRDAAGNIVGHRAVIASD